MSQEKLAQELNVSRQAVYKWENHKGYPDIENLIRISELFDVTIDELIKSDRDLQEKIQIDEDIFFERLSDPGAYIGLVLVFLGVFLFEGSLADTLTVIGLLSILFLTDVVKSIVILFRPD